jgi:hypothetical protein
VNTLLSRMKTALTADSTLSAYLGTDVVIRKWNSDKLPDFDKYCVVLSPGSVADVPHGMLGIERELSVEIVCLVKYHGVDETLAGETSPGGVGILKLAGDVAAALRANTLSGYIEADADVISSRGEPEPVFGNSLLLLMLTMQFKARRKIQTN